MDHLLFIQLKKPREIWTLHSMGRLLALFEHLENSRDGDADIILDIALVAHSTSCFIGRLTLCPVLQKASCPA